MATGTVSAQSAPVKSVSPIVSAVPETDRSLASFSCLPSNPPAMKVKLLSLAPGTPWVRIIVNKLPAVLGRNPAADLHLDDFWVSRVHCEISEISGTLLVRDLDSRNGTLVNGQYIKEAHLLPGDRLTAGLTSFQVHYQRSRKKSLASVG